MSTPTGEALSALAYTLPPLTPHGFGLTIEVISILLAIISVIVVCLRVYVRTGLSGAINRFWGVDDYLVVIGFLPFIPSIIFAVYCTRYGAGRHDADLPSTLYQMRVAEYIIYWEINYFISSTIIKLAVGSACLRLDKRKRIVYPIAFNMALMVVIATLALAFVFANCKPFAATWNPTLGSCQTTISLTTVSYIVSAVQMASDWACALIPFAVVAKLQMDRRKKISVVCILGLGIFASIATCVRMPFLKYYNTDKYPTELLYHLGAIILTSNIECSLGIIACSLPPLRKLFKFYYGSTAEESHGHFNSSSYGTKLSSLNPGGKFSTTVGAHKVGGSGDWDRITDHDDDTSSRKGIITSTEVHITRSN